MLSGLTLSIILSICCLSYTTALPQPSSLTVEIITAASSQGPPDRTTQPTAFEYVGNSSSLPTGDPSRAVIITDGDFEITFFNYGVWSSFRIPVDDFKKALTKCMNTLQGEVARRGSGAKAHGNHFSCTSDQQTKRVIFDVDGYEETIMILRDVEEVLEETLDFAQYWTTDFRIPSFRFASRDLRERFPDYCTGVSFKDIPLSDSTGNDPSLPLSLSAALPSSTADALYS